MRGKYKNKKVEYKGITFDSVLEKNRYVFLKDKEDKGLIHGLELQPKYTLQYGFISHNMLTKAGKSMSVRPITYSADFFYIKSNGDEIIEDAKGFKTEVYKIKKKMLLQIIRLESNVEFREIKTATEPI